MSKHGIKRRDFLNGMALGLAAGASLTPTELLAMSSPGKAASYPPALTGMRGSTDRSFEAAHALAWNNAPFPAPKQQTEDTYDLIVVGGGISGLSAAKFFRDQHGSDAKILIVDNHDDFGGHARRNELDVDGKTLLCYGGSQTLQSPSSYSPQAKQVLKDLSINVDRFYDFYDQDYYSKHNVSEGVYYDRRRFGQDKVLPSPRGGLFGEALKGKALRENIRQIPISQSAQEAYIRLMESKVDYLASMSVDEKQAYLRSISYNQFLKDHAGMPDEVIGILQDTFLQLLSVGWEAGSAWDATGYSMPGTWYLGVHEEGTFEEPYIHHFPDGNAGVARALVRDLLPTALAGSSMEDLATRRVDYSQLDLPDNAIRIRLNSTAVNVAHSADEKHVDVSYVSQGTTYRARARHTVLACYNNMIPYLCKELPAPQVEALQYATKIPFVIGSFAVRNWRAFESAGFHDFYSPGDVYFKHLSLDFPVSMGDYQFSQGPDSPIVISAWYSPTVRGLPARQQYKAGRRKLYEMSFDDFETDLRQHLDGMLGPYGFDFEREVAAITLNRWSHGYAYEFEEIGTPANYWRREGPHIAGRAQLGRISIANSDSEAYAYVDGAIDAAHRAVTEQISFT